MWVWWVVGILVYLIIACCVYLCICDYWDSTEDVIINTIISLLWPLLFIFKVVAKILS
jgi:hypothetical protein